MCRHGENMESVDKRLTLKPQPPSCQCPHFTFLKFVTFVLIVVFTHVLFFFFFSHPVRAVSLPISHFLIYPLGAELSINTTEEG